MLKTTKVSGPVPHGGDDLVVTREPVVGASVSQVGRLFGVLATSSDFAAPEHSSPLAGAISNGGALNGQGFSRSGFRHFVPAELGGGYWDFFYPLPHVMLSVTDCNYRKDFWAPVHGENVFKIRVLCAGTLLDPNQSLFLQGPGVNFAYHPRQHDWGYYFKGG
ncbi:MAG: hypothetical protein FJX52_08905 [Alphaproteobacteria bacterium]|nr:hypothetical protein [Alphaproteobacteria bacterium]